MPATERIWSPGRKPASAPRPSAVPSGSFSARTSPTTAPPKSSAFGTMGGSAQTASASRTAKTQLPNGPATETITRFHQAAGGTGPAAAPAAVPSPPDWIADMPDGSSCGSET